MSKLLFLIFSDDLNLGGRVTLGAGSQSIKVIWDPSTILHVTIQYNRCFLLVRCPHLSFSFGPPGETFGHPCYTKGNWEP